MQFNRLQRGDMAAIVRIQLQRLQELLTVRHITLELDEQALGWLGEAGYDPVYGARPLKRVIQRVLQNPLAGQLLEGTIHDGEVVHVGADRDGLVINGRLAEAA